MSVSISDYNSVKEPSKYKGKTVYHHVRKRHECIRNNLRCADHVSLFLTGTEKWLM